jgi:diaminopimelate epimerase
MRLPFFKYHGAGNDFILLDDRHANRLLTKENIAFLCDRHFGIGADGLILLQEVSGFDFAMVYYNSDGNESTMCGNGGRCITAFARHLGITAKTEAYFCAIDGPHQSVVLAESGDTMLVKLKMVDVDSIDFQDDHAFLNTGSPHVVREVKMLADFDVRNEGRKIRNSSAFAPGGTNVNFIEFDNKIINIRTYERGVEDETLACGTGVTAAALVAAVRMPERFFSPVSVNARGGNLKVYFSRESDSFRDVWLEGSAQKVFEGEIEIA